MRRILTTASALVLAASAAKAELLTEFATFGDLGETETEETAEFVGSPVYGGDGVLIGAVTRAQLLPDGDRRIFVAFDEDFSDELSGLIFTLDERWETDGSLSFVDDAAQVRDYVEGYADTHGFALQSPDVLTQ